MEKKKVIVAWGAGALCSNYITNGLKDVIELIIDNDRQKEGSRICGIPVVHPSGICDWKQYFIIIISQYEEEIAQQLMEYGLEKDSDFISYKEYCSREIPLRIVQETLRESFLRGESGWLREKVYGKKDYDALKMRYEKYGRYEEALGLLYKKMPGRVGGYIGRCAACEEERTFVVDYVWSEGRTPAWRETVTCPYCNCNSRMRFVIDYLDGIRADQSVFVYEAVTSTFRELQKKIPGIQGSEYIGKDCQSGQVIDGIMHQDAMHLSFLDASFDYMVSNDVLEHVADFRRALREAYRCLKKDGHLIVSIPVFKDREATVIRTKMISEDCLEYILPPVYHGNPLSAEGSLVFTEFGWDFLDELKWAGFKEAYAVAYFSAEDGYFGDLPVIFEAVK